MANMKWERVSSGKSTLSLVSLSSGRNHIGGTMVFIDDLDNDLRKNRKLFRVFFALDLILPMVVIGL